MYILHVIAIVSRLSLLSNGLVKALLWQQIHATIDELSDASFSMQSVSYQGKQVISSSQNFFLCFTVGLIKMAQYSDKMEYTFTVQDLRRYGHTLHPL
jgi:hypothetical protein